MTHKYSPGQIESAEGRPRVWAVRVTNGTNSANLHWLENLGPADTIKGEVYRDGVHLGHY